MKNFNHYKQIKRVRISENRNLKKELDLIEMKELKTLKKIFY